jgi:hypothetical protein
MDKNIITNNKYPILQKIIKYLNIKIFFGYWLLIIGY